MLKYAIHTYLSQNPEKFNGAVLVSQEGRLVYKEAFGIANREWNIPNTCATRFRIGSVTKSITALAMLMLAGNKRINLSDPVGKFLPAFSTARGATLTHLLNHTSGIGNLTMQPDFAVRSLQPHSVDELLEWIESLPPESEPGEKFSYSNSGYLILGKIIETVSGLPYEDFLDHRIFQPAGMQNTILDSRTILLHKASGYEMTPAGELQNASYMDMSNAYSAGGLVSTAEDLHLLDSALDEGVLFPSGMTAQIFAFDERQPYRYGWHLARTARNQALAFHHGGINGYTASYMKLLDKKAAVIVLSNVSTLLTSTLAGVIAEALDSGN
ncbi:serine hydrolase [Paenibacillus sp. FJAT-26967]|uniref:serine hydrolase domain-containing protein n=1 Tax=Paenibacillus sp. FJAT-26967 TaxID=1729690 RepID=UPI000838DEB6|nr:serine hydrolase domain-containing protein [Paenibacillus sp. FJAT-26967]